MRSAPSGRRKVAGRASGDGRERLQALTRGLRALAQVNRVGVTTNGAIASKLGLKYSTAYRILTVLTDMGLLHHDALGHQFFLAGGARELGAGFSDVPFVDHVALPRMRAWTREHGLPLLLVSEAGGVLTVRASTDTHWAASGERHVAGARLAARGSSEAAIFRAFGRAGSSSSAVARTIRRQGHARRVLRSQGEIHVSFPIVSSQGLVACLSIRCPLRLAGRGARLPWWVPALRELAADIAAGLD